MRATDIDLTQDPEEDSEDLKVTPGEKAADESIESNFPHFHYESEGPLGIPKSGVMQVEYEVVFEEPDEDSWMTTYKIDLRRIVGVESGGEPAPEDLTEPAVGALDRLAAAKTKERNVQG